LACKVMGWEKWGCVVERIGEGWDDEIFSFLRWGKFVANTVGGKSTAGFGAGGGCSEVLGGHKGVGP